MKPNFIGTFHLSTFCVTYYIPKQFHEFMNQNKDGRHLSRLNILLMWQLENCTLHSINIQNSNIYL